MQIKTNVTTERVANVNIPSFWMYESSSGSIREYIAVLDEKTAVKLFTSDNYSHVAHTTPGGASKEIVDASDGLGGMKPIGEEQFLAAHRETLRSLSLDPVLVDNDPNDLKEVL